MNYLYNGNRTSGTGAGTKLMEGPLWFVRPGYLYSNSLYYYDVYGSYWSSTPSGNVGAYRLLIHIDDVAPANAYRNAHIGWPIRCVAM